MLITAGSNRVRRAASFALGIGAIGGIALMATGVPSFSWWLVVGAPVALYALYALALRGFLPRRGARRPVTGRPAAVPDATQRDVDWLLLVRGLACALVYVHHSGMAFRRDFTYGGSWSWVILGPAWLGMTLFFTLSGYLMGKGFYTGRYTLTESSVWQYLRSRFLRIYPLMIVVGLFGVIWQSPQLLSTPQTLARIALFGFSTGYGGTGTIGVMWSLSTEWQFYLLVPFVFAVAVRTFGLHRPVPTTRLAIATVAILAAGSYIRYYQWSRNGAMWGWGTWVYPNLFCNLDVFLLGFLVNWWLPSLRRFASVLARSWPALLLAIYLPYSWISYQAAVKYDPHWMSFWAIFLPGLTALFILPVIAGCEQLNQREKLRAKPHRRTAAVLFWIGALTYPVYLIHSSIMLGVLTGLPVADLPTKFLITTILVIIGAWILHETVERRVLEFRDRKRVSEPDATTAPVEVPQSVSAVGN